MNLIRMINSRIATSTIIPHKTTASSTQTLIIRMTPMNPSTHKQQQTILVETTNQERTHRSSKYQSHNLTTLISICYLFSQELKTLKIAVSSLTETSH